MKKWISLVILAVLLCVLVACVAAIYLLAPLRAETFSTVVDLPPQATGFILSSPAFQDGDPIPLEYTCDGEDISPPLAWGAPPEGTRSFAIILDDPDAPLGTWTHWIVYQIPGNTRSLDPDLRPRTQIDDTVLLFGKNSWGDQAYGGPCPPSGEHRYIFQLYALDIMPDLPDKVKKTELLELIQGHILGYAELTGTYGR